MRKSKKYIRMPAYALLLVAAILILLAGIPSCSSGDTQNEQFNNNSSGMDRDHTQVDKEDTLQVNSSVIKDSIKK